MTRPLPASFQVIRLDLAREPGHPSGSAHDRYTLVLPLAADGRILQAEAHAHPEHCHAAHAAEDGSLRAGAIRRSDEGAWVLDFGSAPGDAEEGFRFAEERFAPGEYVSIRRDGAEHTYRVVSLQPA